MNPKFISRFNFRLNRRYLAYLVPVGALTAAMLLGTGCSKHAAPPAQVVQQPQPAPAPPTDSQIAAQVQSQIGAEDALKNLPIQVLASNGVVTLSGKVNDDAARELAANDAAQVAGVKTVVNNLVVAPERAAAPARRVEPKKKKAPAVVADDNPPPPPPVDNSVPPPPPAQATPPPPPPPPQPVAQKITIPVGTDIPVRISEALETGKTQTNDAFHGVLTSDLIVNGVVAIPQGSRIVGRVIEAKDAAHFKGNASLSLELMQVTTPGVSSRSGQSMLSGNSQSAAATGAKSQKLTLVTDPLVRQGAARGKNTAEKAGGGALLGTLIGALAGGGKGALIGAAAGAGAGAGVNAITKGQQVKIPSETILHFKLKDPAQVTVLVMPGGQGIKSYSSGSDPSLQ